MFSAMDAISPPIQAILEIFDGPLRELRFGDIDAPTLRRLASEVESSAAELEAQQAALNALRQTLSERQEQLLQQAQRALAYARVYAENDEALSAQLAAIHLPRGAKRAKAEAAPAAASSPTASDAPSDAARPGRKAGKAAVSTVEMEPATQGAHEDDASRDTASASEEREVAPSPARRGKRGRGASRDDVAMDGS